MNSSIKSIQAPHLIANSFLSTKSPWRSRYNLEQFQSSPSFTTVFKRSEGLMRCPADWTNTRRGVPALPTFQRLFVSWSKFVELTGRNPVNPGGGRPGVSPARQTRHWAASSQAETPGNLTHIIHCIGCLVLHPHK